MKTKTDLALEKAVGKKILSITMEDDKLTILFGEGVLIIEDQGQRCCEKRYMETSDELGRFKDSTFLGIETKSADVVDEPDGNVHEVQFLDVKTSDGIFQITTHNINNGYYSGFEIVARWGSNSIK